MARNKISIDSPDETRRKQAIEAVSQLSLMPGWIIAQKKLSIELERFKDSVVKKISAKGEALTDYECDMIRADINAYEGMLSILDTIIADLSDRNIPTEDLDPYL